jgi:hypothetical protein
MGLRHINRTLRTQKTNGVWTAPTARGLQSLNPVLIQMIQL